MKFAFLIGVLSVLSVSAEFVKPEDIETGATYALTLSTNPSKVLDSSHGLLAVGSLDQKEAEDVGSDDGKRWKFKESDKTPTSSQLQYVMYCVGGGGEKGGYLDYVKKLRGIRFSTSQSAPPTNLVIVSKSGGIKIGFKFKKYTKWLANGNDGWRVLDEDSAAIWMVTKFVLNDLDRLDDI